MDKKLRTVTAEYIIEGEAGDFVKDEIFECELPPEGRTVILYKTKFEITQVIHNMDDNTAKIYLNKL